MLADSHGTMISRGARPSTIRAMSPGAASASSATSEIDGAAQRLGRGAEQPRPRDPQLVHAAVDEGALRHAGAQDRRRLVQPRHLLQQRQAGLAGPLAAASAGRRAR